MARDKNSLIEDLFEIASKLPWWADVLLALVSYLALHIYSASPVGTLTGPGQMGTIVVKSFARTLATFGQFIFPFVFLLGAIISFINTRKQKQLYENVATSQKISALGDMGWKEFEMMISEFFRRRGFNASLTGDGADGGVDIVLKKGSEKYLVQCKQWKAYKVGVPQIRELYGVIAAEGATGGYFVTSGEYTSEARKFAEGKNIRLIDGQKLTNMIKEVRQSNPSTINNSEAKIWNERERECPDCGASMVKRIARKGANAGKEFLGCSNYPKCHGTRALEN
ncbi:MAG: restriction endonuclease [Geobacteraceae bacterium]|nr:restriction endonuclease [Geobacteraceae bacterium]